MGASFAAALPRLGWIWLGLLALAVVVYAPSLDGQFLWDDDAHVTRPELRSLAGLGRIWFEIGATQQYYPLLHTAFWVEHRLWGDGVVGYHLVNVALHATSALLFLALLRRLKVPGAPLAAAAFLVHPVQVESVAWISELKNTLSLALYLGSLLAFLRFEQDRRWLSYAMALVLFVLGLLTKTIVATLPGVLLVLIWWQHGRLSWRRDVLPLVPWWALGLAAGIATAAIEQSMLGAEGAHFDLTVADRIVLAGRAVTFYLAKLAWPSPLLFVYPRWEISAAWPWPLVPLGVLGLLIACWLVRRRWRSPLAVGLLYIGALFPALGFVNVYPFVFSFVADHFQYVPSLAIIAAASALLALLANGRPAAVRYGGGVIVVAALSVMSWGQCHTYADPETLYRTTLEGNPSCYLCLNNLGTLAVARGDTDTAVEQFEGALRVEPDSAEAHNNLANLLAQRGDLAGAVGHYERSLAIAPRNVIARTNLGIVLVRMGRLSEGRAAFEEALRMMPGYAPAAQNLAVLRRLGVQ